MNSPIAQSANQLFQIYYRNMNANSGDSRAQVGVARVGVFDGMINPEDSGWPLDFFGARRGRKQWYLLYIGAPVQFARLLAFYSLHSTGHAIL